jgi:hypothetical protein
VLELAYRQIYYEELYRMVRDTDCTVVDCWEEGEWQIEFRKALSLREFELWKELLEDLNEVNLERHSTDSVIWALEKKG